LVVAGISKKETQVHIIFFISKPTKKKGHFLNNTQQLPL